MWIFVNVAMLVFATLIAGAAAVSVYWLLLRATLQLMRPATIRTGVVRTGMGRTDLGHSSVGRSGPDRLGLQPISQTTSFAAVPTLFKEGSK